MINFVTSNIYKLMLNITILLLAGMFTFVAGQVRVSPTPNPNPRYKVLQPSQEFDPQLAKTALERGTSTIKGQACSFYNHMVLKTNVKVALFPWTPYLEEWYNLRETKTDKNTQVRASDEAFKYRIATETNAKAEFQFTELKPGKYYILAWDDPVGAFLKE